MSNTDDAPFDDLIEQSSLGALGARQLRQRTPQPKTDEIRRIQEERLADQHERRNQAEQRHAERRERLIQAAYTLFANPGFHCTTIERLCATACISNRAFYECFADRDELMRAVYDRCVEETLALVDEAIAAAPATPEDRLLAGIGEYVRFVTSDVRRARIMHLEVGRVGDVLSIPRQRAVMRFAHIIEGAVTGLPDGWPKELHLLALGVSGVIQELLLEWLQADQPPPTDLVINTAVHMLLASVSALPDGFPRWRSV